MMLLAEPSLLELLITSQGLSFHGVTSPILGLSCGVRLDDAEVVRQTEGRDGQACYVVS